MQYLAQQKEVSDDVKQKTINILVKIIRGTTIVTTKVKVELKYIKSKIVLILYFF